MPLPAPLIPLPTSSHPSTSWPLGSDPFDTPIESKVNREELEQKYATLFEPGTPRASRSASPDAVALFSKPSAPAPAPKILRVPSQLSEDDDFGAFVGGVEVGFGEDPLSAGLGASGFPSVPPNTAMPHKKEASADRRLVNEVLEHEDEPLWFVKSSDSQEPAPTKKKAEEVKPENDRDWLSKSLTSALDSDLNLFSTLTNSLAFATGQGHERSHSNPPTRERRPSESDSHSQSPMSRRPTSKPTLSQATVDRVTATIARPASTPPSSSSTPNLSSIPVLAPPSLTGLHPSTTPVLTPSLAAALRPYLPALPRLSKSWALLYSTDQHGMSLGTLYDRCDVTSLIKGKGRPSLGGIQGRGGGMAIIIQDADDTRLGAYVSEGISKSSRYYGSGDSFVFSAPVLPDTPPSATVSNAKVFKWTGRNSYVALTEPTFLSFGAGNKGGRYGLFIDGSMTEGSSAWCETFGNDVLCGPDRPAESGGENGKESQFEVVGVEVWGIVL